MPAIRLNECAVVQSGFTRLLPSIFIVISVENVGLPIKPSETKTTTTPTHTSHEYDEANI